MNYIYLLKSNINGEYLYKIGITRNIDKRKNQLNTANPHLILKKSFKTNHGFKLENSLHNRFKNKKVNGEWFRLSDEDVNNFYNYCEKIEKAFDVMKNNNPFY